MLKKSATLYLWTAGILKGFFTFNFDVNFLKNSNLNWITGVQSFSSLHSELRENNSKLANLTLMLRH